MKKTGLKKALILTMALTSLLSFAACASKEPAAEVTPDTSASAPETAPEVKEQTPLEKIKEKGTLVLGTSLMNSMHQSMEKMRLWVSTLRSEKKLQKIWA